MDGEVGGLEHYGRGVQQVLVRRLNRPGLRRRIFRIDAVEVESIIRIDETDDHKLAPEQICGGARKLNMCRDDSRQSVSRILARFRFFTGQDESGLESLAVAG